MAMLRGGRLRETVAKQRVANSKGGGKACRDWCEAKTAQWPVHKDRSVSYTHLTLPTNREV